MRCNNNVLIEMIIDHIQLSNFYCKYINTIIIFDEIRLIFELGNSFPKG